MTPPWQAVGALVLAAVATAAAFGALIERARTRRQIEQANALVKQAAIEVARWRRAMDDYRNGHEHELECVEHERNYALAQLAEALRIIADLSDARVADADDPFRGQWVAPTPQAWAAFQQGLKKPGEN